MIRVAFLTPSLHLAGPEQVIATLARNFISCKPVGCIFTGKPEHPAMRRKIERCMPITQVRGTEIDLSAAIRHVCKDADVLVSWGFQHLKACTMGLGIPIVDVSHTEPSWREPVALLEQSCRGATHYVAVSDRAADSFPADLRKQVAIIPNGIELDRVQVRAGQEVQRDNLKIGPNDKVALYLGRFHRVKNLELLIAAARHLPDFWKVVLVGDGPERFKLEAVSGPNVLMLPQTDVIGDLLHMANVFVLPSKTEACSLAEMEAKVAGLPVVRLKDLETNRSWGEHITEHEKLAYVIQDHADHGSPVYNVLEAGIYSAAQMAFRWENFLTQICMTHHCEQMIGPVYHGTPRRRKRLLAMYDQPGWAYWHRAKQLEKHAPPDWEVILTSRLPSIDELCKYDVVVSPTYGLHDHKGQASSTSDYCWPKLRGRIQEGKLNTKLVGILSIDSMHRPGNCVFLEQACDAVVYTNVAHFENRQEDSRNGDPEMRLIANGVDLDVFRSLIPIEERPRRILFCSSRYHAVQKGTELLEELRPDFGKLGWALDLKVIDTSQVPPMGHQEMVDWYNSGRVYIVASEHEGTPNPALEAAACGCIVVATAVGNMPQLIDHNNNGKFVKREHDSILEAINLIHACGTVSQQEMSQNMLSTIQRWNWADRAAQYFELFEELTKSERDERTAEPVGAA